MTQWVENGRGASLRGALARLFKRPLAITLACFVLAWLMATFFSVDPTASWWGDYERMQATFTILSYLVIFGAVGCALRRQERLDRLHVLRPFLGYGPETLPNVLAQRFNSNISRTHNLVWDLWSSVGALGLAAYLALFLAVFWHTYRWLGLARSPREGMAFCGGVVGCALLAPLAGHMIETGFSFPIATTQIFFWIYAGALLALWRSSSPTSGSDRARSQGIEPEATKRGNKGPASRSTPVVAAKPGWSERGPMLVAAAIATTILVPLLFTFIQPPQQSTTPLSIVTNSLTRVMGRQGTFWMDDA